MSQKQEVVIFWFRRDLRLSDNKGFYKALQSGNPVLPIFIFDTNILDGLQEVTDARVTFIVQRLQQLNQQLKSFGKGIRIFHGKPLECWAKILEEYHVVEVFTNRDYEPYAQQRDRSIYEFLAKKGIKFLGYKDHVIFEKDEILTQKGTPYTVFTPYSNAWRRLISPSVYQTYPSETLLENLVNFKSTIPRLEEIGFQKSTIQVEPYQLTKIHLQHYKTQRNIPSISGTSKVSPHLRFGTISIREVYRQTKSISEKFVTELIWRDFYSQVLYHFPHVVTENFRSKYDAVQWRNNQEEFQLWCEGKTGFPIVDAGMRELNQTGWMHNRVRMITASFLCKDLLIDWRWGEAYFAEKLLDYDLASNNGGWQWAAGTGTDAAPYFRIFNPTSQQEKFDPNFDYVKQWVPEFGTNEYIAEIVDHKAARVRALAAYKEALQ